MFFDNPLRRTTGEDFVRLNNFIQVILENSQSLAFAQLIGVEIIVGSGYGIHILLVSLCTCSNFIAENLKVVVGTEESLHIRAIVDCVNRCFIFIDESLLCNDIILEFASSYLILILDFLELFGSTEVKFVHLDCIAAVCLRYDYLIIYVLFGSLGAEAKVRRFSINGMQTILTDVLLSVDEHPTLSILGCLRVIIEVSAIDVPSTPVTTLICASVVTCGQRIEERIGLASSTEDDVGVAVRISLTAPLGCIHLCLLTSFRINFC